MSVEERKMEKVRNHKKARHSFVRHAVHFQLPRPRRCSVHTTLTLKDPRNTMCSTTAGVSAMKTGTELYMSLYERANPPTRPGISFL